MELVLENVTKKYKDKTAVCNISTELASGQLIGLIGKNGAGKTTLMKMLATIIKPTSGQIFFDGENTVRNPNRVRNTIGYLPQEVSVYPNLTAYEYLNYVAALKGMKKSEAIHQIRQFLLVFHLEDVKDKKLEGFSGGMKQRIGLIGTLLNSPKIIIADEPTTGLDPEERITVRNMLSELAKERIVILSTHIVSDIEAVASRILMLKDGSLIFDDTPYKLIAKADGCVWEYTSDSIQSGARGISSMVQTKDGIHVRQVSRHKPIGRAVPVSSTLEDACLFALEGEE